MRFSISSFAFAAIALLSAPAAAQSCSDLTVTGDGSPGTTLTFAIANAPADAPTVVLVGLGGTTTYPTTIIDFGLAAPFFPIGGGLADMNGDFSTSIDVPASMTRYVQADAQGVSLTFTFPPMPPTGGGTWTLPISFCTSDIEAFNAGTPPTN